MPHAVFNLGSQTAAVDVGGRPLIPGVVPGGSRAGHPTKPALLIRDAWMQVNAFSTSAAVDIQGILVFLKLSQEEDLTPGLILPVGELTASTAGATANRVDSHIIRDTFHAQGTIWAPRVVGVRFEEPFATNLGDWDVDVHLDYESVDVPWMDWFIMWEFLDGIVDNEREY